jgi:hypothetical protein
MMHKKEKPHLLIASFSINSIKTIPRSKKLFHRRTYNVTVDLEPEITPQINNNVFS